MIPCSDEEFYTSIFAFG